MAFLNYGTGTWGTPEFGITELFGGKKDSIDFAKTWGSGQIPQTNVFSSTPQTSPQYGPIIDTSLYNNNLSGSGKSSDAYKNISGGSAGSTGYSKSAAAKSLGVSTAELSRMAKEAGFDSTEEFMQNYNPQINNIYDEAYGYLNQQEQRLRAGEQDYYGTFTAPYEAQLPLIEQARQSGVANLQNQQSEAQLQEQNALAAARQLYNELSARNRQAFGGVSSVGQASSEILGREQMRQQGNIQNTSAQVIQGIMTKINDVESKAQAMTQQLQIEKENALSQAKLAFQDKLDAINNDRFMLAQQKAQLKYQEMVAYRDRVQAIQDRNTEFAMNIEAMREQARLEAQQVTQNMNSMNDMYGAQAQEALSNQAGYNNAYVNNIGNSSSLGSYGNALSTILSPSGYFNWSAQNSQKKLEDLYGNN